MNKELATNSILSHYRILSKIGAGGMGEVYLAQDTSELGRNVALKIVPAEVAKDKDRLQRFTQEARTVSNLNHPNILTVYEFGQTDSGSFIAAEYIDGVTLREHLSGRRLKLVDILDLGIQIVAALNAAHEAGVTHRDLKPENVMVRRDQIVKVLDFGLAKLTTPSSTLSGNEIDSEAGTKVFVQTEPGLVMGTVSYMSPEQSVGRDIDQRTDIWSFGVLLYEMLAGSVPFQGKDIHRQIIAIQETEAAPLSQLVEGVPDRLEEIVAKCLAKNKDERYQTAKDLLIDLRNLRRKLDVDAEIERTVAPAFRSTSAGALGGSTEGSSLNRETTSAAVAPASSAEYVVTGIKQHKLAAGIALLVLLAAVTVTGFYLRARNSSATIQSIAVMPFVNESSKAEFEYLSDGMTETLITSLSQIPNLNVKARSSVFRYKGKETSPKTIGQELNVQAVLNGRVAQRGDDLTLNLELVDVQTENVIWSEQYNRKQTDLVSLQSDIARDVSSKLKIKLSGADEQKLTRNYTQNAEAYKLYLQGRFYANRRTPKDSRKAIEYFQQAISIDPNYALAYGGLAISYAYLTIYGDEPGAETFPKAREFASKASQLDGNLAEPHILLGLLKFLQEHDSVGWERESELALAANPNSTDAHRLNGLRFLFLGRFDEALAEEQRALEIEPLSTAGNINYSYALFYAGRIDDSEAQTKKAIELAPDFWLSHHYLSIIYRYKGNYAQSVEELAKSKDLRDETEAARLIRASFAKGGWQGFLRAMTVEHAPMKMTPYNIAGFYAEAGDKDRAFAALNEAVDKYDQFIGFVKIDPFLKPLRDDPRFQQVVKRIGFPN
ncbi:MAG: eukaryotic-like serine/threonine-protein kinase [Blastocatellia bacterium]|jgi:serine/threonine-protein kinase|nr:eukaryotic-like serine/threonine-protein kinase [Blastocatellia bacterium]